MEEVEITLIHGTSTISLDIPQGSLLYTIRPQDFSGPAEEQKAV
ncbi:MAG: hypothetical protein ACUVQZ_05535 [Candidatus Caldatribacteriaceae bacterium]